MPFILEDTQKDIDRGIPPVNVGELTYQVFAAGVRYLEEKDEVRYADLAEVIAALEAAKLEFYRQVVAPYEEKKQLSSPIPALEALKGRLTQP